MAALHPREPKINDQCVNVVRAEPPDGRKTVKISSSTHRCWIFPSLGDLISETISTDLYSSMLGFHGILMGFNRFKSHSNPMKSQQNPIYLDIFGVFGQCQTKILAEIATGLLQLYLCPSVMTCDDILRLSPVVWRAILLDHKESKSTYTISIEWYFKNYVCTIHKTMQIKFKINIGRSTFNHASVAIQEALFLFFVP